MLNAEKTIMGDMGVVPLFQKSEAHLRAEKSKMSQFILLAQRMTTNGHTFQNNLTKIDSKQKGPLPWNKGNGPLAILS